MPPRKLGKLGAKVAIIEELCAQGYLRDRTGVQCIDYAVEEYVEMENEKRWVVGIVTFKKCELDAVLAALGLDESNRRPKGNYTYYSGELLSKTGQVYVVNVVRTLKMGQLFALNATSEMIRFCRPEIVIGIGIAGGVPKEVELGDVIVCFEEYYYEFDKVTPEGSLPSPRMFSADPLLCDRCANLPPWSGVSDDELGVKGADVRVHLGVIASGEKIVASPELVAELKKRHRKIKGFDTETDGFHVGAWLNTEKHVRCITFRGVSDHADAKKASPKWKKQKALWQAYAAKSVASYLRHFLDDDPLRVTGS